MEKPILVIDLTFLPTEIKEKGVEKTIEDLEAKYGCNVLLIDSSRENTKGALPNYSAPVYIVK